ncbi:hypothetical protein ACGFS9_22335 [Streptomyces sp. NPDC048566]|uniref:hypothetical protein n=1 Tax=Streptomyces sp. NPDC048566 TaxID=3365569 RepID=UPI00371E2389
MSQTEETAPPGDYRLLLPEGWFRVLLDPHERDRSVDALVRRRFHGVDDAPHLREELGRDLRRRAAKAHRAGGIELYLSLQEVGPFTIPASLLVTLAPLEDARRLPLDTLAQVLAEGGEEAAVSVEELPSGAAVRVRRLVAQGDEEGAERPARTSLLVEYHLPVPGASAFLLLSFSTPLEPIADAMTELFDAIAGSLTWTE